jgi:hypothetical protein
VFVERFFKLFTGQAVHSKQNMIDMTGRAGEWADTHGNQQVLEGKK